MQEEIPDTQASPKKKKKIRRIIIGLILFILFYPLLSISLLYLIGPPKLEICRETVGIDNPPMREDGTVDYLEYINDINSAGVTPENNFINACVEIIGPDAFLDEGIRKKYLDAIGYDELNAKPASYVRVEDVAASYDDKCNYNDLILMGSQKYLQDAAERQKLAEYISKNNQCILDIQKALSRPRFYSPFMSTNEQDRFLFAGLPKINTLREIARVILCRAMLKAAEGKLNAAWQDIMAVRMLGIKFLPHNENEQNCLITYLVGIAIMRASSETAMALLADERLTAEQLATFRKEFENCPIKMPVVKQFLLGERSIAIDAAIDLCNGKSSFYRDFWGEKPNLETQIFEICAKNADPNYVLRKINCAYDLLQDNIGNLSEIRQNPKAYSKLMRLEELLRENRSLQPKLIPVLWMPPNIQRRIMSDMAANYLLNTIFPSFSAVKYLFGRTTAMSDLVDIGLALREYQLTKGEYPKKLSQLVPEYFKELPKDPFSGKDYIYKPVKNGFKLYSIGQNFTDDGGVVIEDHPNEGDIVLEVPSPDKTRK